MTGIQETCVEFRLVLTVVVFLSFVYPAEVAASSPITACIHHTRRKEGQTFNTADQPILLLQYSARASQEDLKGAAYDNTAHSLFQKAEKAA